MKILLTGCSGLLGNAVLNAALPLGKEQNTTFEFVGLDVCKSTFTPPLLEFHQGSYADAALLDRILPGCDAVIHTAAYHGRCLTTYTPTEFVEVNVGGLATMLEACIKHNVRRFVFSSTMEILIGSGWEASGMQRVNETCPPRPNTIYPQSKLLCESLGQYYAAEKGIEFLALRYQNIDPPNSSPLGLLARSVTANDAARANLLASIVEDVSYDMMLIGPSTPFTNRDIVEAQNTPAVVIEKYWPSAMEILLTNNLSPRPHDFWPAVSVDHARRVLGWVPEQTFEGWLHTQGWRKH